MGSRARRRRSRRRRSGGGATPAPLAFVAGSFRYDNAAVFYSPEHPSAFVNFDYFGNRWVSPEKLAAQGLLTICLKDDNACLDATERFATPAARREPLTLAHTLSAARANLSSSS